jgi:hypothetical protein
MKVLSTRTISKFVFLSFVFLLTSCSPSPNGLICYEEDDKVEGKANEKKEEFSLLIGTDKNSGFIKSGEGFGLYGNFGNKWKKVDLETTPDTISFKNDLVWWGVSTNIDRSTLVGVNTSGDEILDFKVICKKANFETPQQKI